MKKKRNTPTIGVKVVNFIKSLFRHLTTGMKKCSQSTILERYSVCQGCEFFNFISNEEDIKATCDVCGCNVSDKKIFMNKLAWKDQKCPKGKW